MDAVASSLPASSASASPVSSSPVSAARTPSARSADPAQRVSKDFEAMMVTQMLQSMFAGIKPDRTFGGGQGERTWRGFMLQEYGKAIAESGSLGIARLVHAEVARLYQQQSEGTPT